VSSKGPKSKIPWLQAMGSDRASLIKVSYRAWGRALCLPTVTRSPRQSPPPIEVPLGVGPSLLPPPTGGGFRFGGPSFAKVRFSRRLRTGPVRRRAHSRRAPGKGTPPHGRWGGVGGVEASGSGGGEDGAAAPHRHEGTVPVGHA
jgi:hypothetical protein